MVKRAFLLLLLSSFLLSSCVSSVHSSIPVSEWIHLGTDGEDTAWSYVLLAKETVSLGTNSRVNSGDIGANGDGGGSVTVTIGLNARVSSSSKIKGDYIWLKTNSRVGDVYYNEIKKGMNVKILGEEYTPIDLPVSSLPYFPSFSPGTTDITVNVGETLVLEEGDYRDVEVKTNGRLIFSGGIYNLKSLVASSNTRLYFDAPSEVRIEERMSIGTNCKVRPKPGSGIDASDIVFYVYGTDGSKKAVEFGVNNKVEVNIYAPNGTIWLKTNCDATGAYIGKYIVVDTNVKLTLDSAFTDYASADKIDLYFYNDGTYAYFKETLAADPDPSSFTYTVYLDKPAGEDYQQDFRLVYSDGIAELQSWDGSEWNYVSDITVTVDGRNIVFIVSLSSISNPSILQDTNVWFVEYYGSNSYEFEVDRAPNTESYLIKYYEIPNLPGVTALVFIPAVLATVYLVYRWRFRQGG